MRTMWTWSCLCLGLIQGQETQGDTSMTWDHMTTLHGDGNWTAKVHADSQAFVQDIMKWMHHVVDDKSWTQKATLSESFKAQSIPHDDRSGQDQPCGDVPLHRVAKVLTKVLKAEHITKKVTKTTMKLEWKPSKECMEEHAIDNMGGGGGAGFRVICDGTPLLQASGGGGGALMHSEFGNFFIGGSTIELQLEDGKLKVSGGGLGKWGGAIVMDTIPEGTDEAIHRVKAQIRQCAANGTLVVRGAGGGGWSEKKTGLDAAEVKEGFSFGFSFEYGVVPSDNHTEGEGDQDATPEEESPEEEDTPVEETPEEEDTPVEETPEEENTPVEESPEEEETPDVEEVPEEGDETPEEDEVTPSPRVAENEAPSVEAADADTEPTAGAPVKGDAPTAEVESPVEDDVAPKSTEPEAEIPTVDAVSPKEPVADQTMPKLDLVSAAAAQTFTAVSNSCQDSVNPSDMCFMRNSFGKEWFLPVISDESVIREDTPVVQENVVSYGTFAIGMAVVAGVAFVLVRTRRRRSGYSQLDGGDNMVSV